MTDRAAIEEMDVALRDAGDQERAVREKQYLKSDLTHYGAAVPAIRKVATAFARRNSELTRARLLETVEHSWAEPVHERRMAAVELLDIFGNLLEPEDLSWVERLIRESRIWALVDGLAATVAGGLVVRFPELGMALDRWAVDEDLWVRRAALLALLRPLRRGEGDFERFARYADGMLEEREFFIRKAIGWVLREMAKQRPDLVTDWLLPRVARASGITIREAVRHLPDEEREAIMAARNRP